MSFDHSGRVALITGAGSGIGRATALRVASEGAAVAVVDIRLDAAEETVAAIADGGGTGVTSSPRTNGISCSTRTSRACTW
jgi:NAD(P)-dependent dehydrogenase (short-subunit alcohol dehydrogenase family)